MENYNIGGFNPKMVVSGVSSFVTTLNDISENLYKAYCTLVFNTATNDDYTDIKVLYSTDCRMHIVDEYEHEIIDVHLIILCGKYEAGNKSTTKIATKIILGKIETVNGYGITHSGIEKIMNALYSQGSNKMPSCGSTVDLTSEDIAEIIDTTNLSAIIKAKSYISSLNLREMFYNYLRRFHKTFGEVNGTRYEMNTEMNFKINLGSIGLRNVVVKFEVCPLKVSRFMYPSDEMKVNITATLKSEYGDPFKDTEIYTVTDKLLRDIFDYDKESDK